MIKGEILDSQFDHPFGWERDKVLAAMDEFAKQQSLAFNKWWKSYTHPYKRRIPMEELYNQFIEHQNKEQ